MKKGQEYDFNTIEKFAEKNGYIVEELGSNRVGEQFLKLQHQEPSIDIVISFVLVGWRNQNIYECVYSDLRL